jgi:hypothetical protein
LIQRTAGSGEKVARAISSSRTLWTYDLIAAAAAAAVDMQTWDLIDPENSIKREVVMQGPAASSSVKTGNAFARCGHAATAAGMSAAVQEQCVCMRR